MPVYRARIAGKYYTLLSPGAKAIAGIRADIQANPEKEASTEYYKSRGIVDAFDTDTNN